MVVGADAAVTGFDAARTTSEVARAAAIAEPGSASRTASVKLATKLG